MSATLNFECGTAAHNDYVKGCPENWEWAKDEGGYDTGRDFFSVHWQVNTPKPGQDTRLKDAGIIRLHVESPRHDKDPSLNDLKREVIKALLASKVEQVARQRGYGYEVGVKTALAQIQQNKSTEALRVLVPESQLTPTHEENIKAVHATVGWAVDEVLQTFADKLNEHFPVSGRPGG